jgi:hypothetical protein
MTVARSVLALVACMVLLSPIATVAQARPPEGQSQGSEGTHAPKRFDIDAQALATALRAFSEASGTAVLFDDGLVAGRETQGLHGEASPRDALRILLLGTGLEARFSSMNAFTVTLPDAPPATPSAPPGGAAGPVLDGASAAALQSAIERALCARAATRPGTFRLAMQLWIDETGGVADAVALAPSGDPERDGKVLSAVRAARVPAALRRFSPVTVLLTPTRGPGDPCRTADRWEG